MNTYIQQTKDAILEYLGKANAVGTKIAEGRKIYQPDSMQREEDRLRGELMKARKATEEKLDRIYQEATAAGRAWGTLDGSKLTADAQLLQGQGVNPEQFAQLVERYQDNYTMLDALRKYGEAQNKAAEKKAREAGSRDLIMSGPYDLHGIPGPDAKLKEWDDMRQKATRFLNVADGTGFSSDFERSFATSTAQKAFDAWGEDQQPQQQDSSADAFMNAWGFKK